MTATLSLSMLTAVPALAARPDTITRTNALATPWSRHRFGWRRRSARPDPAAIVAAGLDGRTAPAAAMSLSTPWDGAALPSRPLPGVTALPSL